LDSPAVDEQLLRNERDSMLWRAFSRLPGRERALLGLLVSDPLPDYKRTGAAMGCLSDRSGVDARAAWSACAREDAVVGAGAGLRA
jgi:hypothetical protein